MQFQLGFTSECKEVFCWLDIDGVGSLTGKNICRPFLEMMDECDPSLELQMEADCQEMLDKFDANGNGMLEFPEFFKMMSDTDNVISPDIFAALLEQARSQTLLHRTFLTVPASLSVLLTPPEIPTVSSASETLIVAGVVGSQADKLNGVYEPTGELHNGKPLFRRRGCPPEPLSNYGQWFEWLLFTPDQKWIFCPTNDKNANARTGWCDSLDTGKDYPTEVEKWTIYCPQIPGWEDALMKCTLSEHAVSVGQETIEVCSTFPKCGCPGQCLEVIKKCGYVRLHEDGNVILLTEKYLLENGLPQDLHRLFLEDGQLKTVDKRIQEEEFWLDERTKQAQEHFQSGALSLLASEGESRGMHQAWTQWSKEACEIMFEKMEMSKMVSATDERNFIPSRPGDPSEGYKQLQVLAFRPGEIWDENMLRNPALVSGCSGCYGCKKEGCTCQVGLPFYVAVSICDRIRTTLPGALQVLDERQKAYKKLDQTFDVFKTDLELKLSSMAKFEGQLSDSKRELASFSSFVASVFTSSENEIPKHEEELGRAKKRLSTSSDELQRAEDQLNWMKAEISKRQSEVQQFQSQLEGLLSRCSNLPDSASTQSMTDHLRDIQIGLEQDVKGLIDSSEQHEVYTENCRWCVSASEQHVRELQERLRFLDEVRSSKQKVKETAKNLQSLLDAQYRETSSCLQTSCTVNHRLLFCSEQINKLSVYMEEANNRSIRESLSIQEILQSMKYRQQIMETQYKNPVLPHLTLDFICWSLSRPLMQLKNPSDVIDTFLREELNGEILLSVIENSSHVSNVAKELDTLLLETLGMTDIIERKRVVHMIQLLHFGLNPESYSPPGCTNASDKLVCIWTAEKVQEKLKSSGQNDLVTPLHNVSGEVLLLLDLNRKDLAEKLGIHSVKDQEKLRSLIKSLAEQDPVARLRRGEELQNYVSQDDAHPPLASEDTFMSLAKLIPYSTVKEACVNFSNDHLLGSGGFGNVYKCDLIISQQKRTYAVKKMNKHGMQGLSEFSKEVEVLTCCRHPNVLTLVAVSMDLLEPCLIYPLMEGGNLGMRISQEDQPLSWQKRFNIGAEVLRAIVYLHQREPAILHRDIKPENVLLDRNDHARLSDVGLARFFERPSETSGQKLISPLRNRLHSGLATSKIVGTFGYICPTFSAEGKYYPSSDGYGIGVMLLQLLTSKCAVDPDVRARPRELAAKVRKAGAEATALESDPKAGNWSPLVARKMADVALRLVQLEEVDRMECAEALKDMESVMPDLEEQIPEPRECVICLDEIRNMRFLPCGHMIVCSNCIPKDRDCYSESWNCYSCRKKIDDVVQDFPQTNTFVSYPRRAQRALLEEDNDFEEGENVEESDEEEGEYVEEFPRSHSPVLSAEASDNNEVSDSDSF